MRDYDPFTGRFTAKDPLGYAAGDPDLYGYCLDDPVNAVDPTGLFDITAGDVVSWGTTAGIKVAERAGAISPKVAAGLGVVTAPLGDMISPSTAGEGSQFTDKEKRSREWKSKAYQEGWLDIFDSETEREKRRQLGELPKKTGLPKPEPKSREPWQ